jgi:hypothetical protein
MRRRDRKALSGKVKVRLAKRPARRLRKLGSTTFETRTTVKVGGLRYVVRRTFPVRR